MSISTLLLGSAIAWLTVAVVDGNVPAAIAFTLTVVGMVACAFFGVVV